MLPEIIKLIIQSIDNVISGTKKIIIEFGVDDNIFEHLTEKISEWLGTV